MQVEETTQSTPLRPTRAGFVRGLPLSMPVEEVIERGREAGIQLQPSDIHAARYYMKQQGGAGASVPQQLMLGGTFASKSASTTAVGKTGVVGVVGKAADKDDDEDFDLDEEAPAPVAPRRRKIVQSRATLLAQGKEVPPAKEDVKESAKTNGKSNGLALHDRLQARLANATFRQTAKEERKAERAERKAQLKAQKQAERLSAQNALREERQSARAKQEERQARQQRTERLEKATIGKALLDADSFNLRNRRAAKAIATLEEQARLIALRLGTQRVRELLDAMEDLARQA